jgi:hypothetical protein
LLSGFDDEARILIRVISNKPTYHAEKLIATLNPVGINPSASDSGMDILTLLSKHSLSSCLTHLELASLKQHSSTVSHNPTLSVTFQGFNAEAFPM